MRHLFDLAMLRASVRLSPTVESDSFEFLCNYPCHEPLVSFQIPIGPPPPGTLYLGQLRGRTLPVVAARFADQLAKTLEQQFG